MPSYADTTALFTTNAYVKVGLGGAGNFFSKQSLAPSAPIPCPPRSTATVFHSGIGGAGNRKSVQDRAFLTVTEVMDRSSLRRGSAATSWHHGIGGAGNRTSTDDGSCGSLSLSSSSSWKSTGKLSNADKLKEKIVGKWSN